MDHPEEFWAEAAQDIDWTKPWYTVLDRQATQAVRWFVGGEMNTCYNALDRHVESGEPSKPP